jgi:hypothetical protein
VTFADLVMPERDQELQRLFGEDVRVTTLAGQPEPSIIVEYAEQLDCDAVVLDVAPPGVVEHLRDHRPDTQILRPIFEERETRNRYGYPTTKRVFAGYRNVSGPT